MINELNPANMLKKPWDGASLLSTPSTGLYKAHVALHADVKERMVDNLSQSIKVKFIISSMLDPRFKSFSFKGHEMFCESKERSRAERHSKDRGAWQQLGTELSIPWSLSDYHTHPSPQNFANVIVHSCNASETCLLCSPAQGQKEKCRRFLGRLR